MKKKTKYRVTNPKKFITFILTAVAVIISSIILFSHFGEKYNPESVGKSATVSYERLNVRSRPRLSAEIVDTLYFGDTVCLTGRRYLLLNIYGPHPYWVETQYGWVSVKGLSFGDWVGKRQRDISHCLLNFPIFRCKRVILNSISYYFIIYMRIYFSSRNAFMSKKLLQSSDINITILIHECSSSMS